ncbi:hypothetical protein [Allorhizobium undicola]|uniref:hypothetical protein n=1 Tax=Allorhizobium undicola TaxID=78527 RepID=UPI000688C90F|nr:hypothetical protein [Allorhizobium undicola]
MRKRGRHIGTGLRIFCALVLLTLGLAHRPPPALADLQLSLALQLPDGSFSDLCLGDHGLADGHGDAAGLVPCDACILAASTVLPTAPDEALDRPYAGEFDNSFFSRFSLPDGGAWVEPRSRGPPVSA